MIAGLVVGQKVATSGAFLIDAEARLNPSAAASYFGAAGATPSTPETTPTPTVKPAVSTEPIPYAVTTGTLARDTEQGKHPTHAGEKNQSTPSSKKLSAADANLVKIQKICPVTDLPLDSMGGPVPVIVLGRKVFICCEGCEGKLKDSPGKYLAKLPRGK